MPSTTPDDANGVLILQDDDVSDQDAAVPHALPWRILIVDDDVDVHVVTKFALSNTSFQGRRLSFLHAYSGLEALTILRETPDIAMVLLDVIMETPEAGLRVARQVREQLHNELVRIVLRTGQPGQALEHSIIVDYDINDFWCKADLTTRKLFTTVISSLRAYATLKAAAAERDALGVQLAKARQLQAVVDQHALVLTLGPDGRILDANAYACRLAGMQHSDLIGRDLPVGDRRSELEVLRAVGQNRRLQLLVAEAGGLRRELADRRVHGVRHPLVVGFGAWCLNHGAGMDKP